jgi:hypothetical protein
MIHLFTGKTPAYIPPAGKPDKEMASHIIVFRSGAVLPHVQYGAKGATCAFD